ncbi:DUF3418 domain-containing protein [Mycolicibacterium insubricum]|nr:DUF3418 domain-containing protein [Mycolicibacterium insubricum]
MALRRPGSAAELPVRTRRHRRRRHRARTGRRAGAPRRRAIRLGGTGIAPGTHRRPAQVPAQGPAPKLRSGPRHRPHTAGYPGPRHRLAARRPGRRTTPAQRRFRHRRGLRPGEDPHAPAADVRRPRGRRDRGRPRQGPRRTAAPTGRIDPDRGHRSRRPRTDPHRPARLARGSRRTAHRRRNRAGRTHRARLPGAGRRRRRRSIRRGIRHRRRGASNQKPGLPRLLRLSTPSPVKAVERGLAPGPRLMLGNNPDGSAGALIEDCADAAVDTLVTAPVRTRAEFAAARMTVADHLVARTTDLLGRVTAVLTAAHQVAVAIPDAPSAGQRAAIADIRSQRDRLLPPGFVTATGAARLPDLTRYLTAIVRRLERLAQAPSADTERMTRVHAVEDAYDELCQRLSPQRRDSDAVRAIGWQIEELRVSLWAQQLGTPRPVSEQRIYKAIDAI